MIPLKLCWKKEEQTLPNLKFSPDTAKRNIFVRVTELISNIYNMLIESAHEKERGYLKKVAD